MSNQATASRRTGSAIGARPVFSASVIRPWVFWQNEATIAYDYGNFPGGPKELAEGSGTKLKIVSLDWWYERA